MVDRRTEIADHFRHVGAGTSVVLAYAGLIPGVIPLLALTAVVIVVAVAPVLILGLLAAIVAGPPYAAWRVVGRGRRRRRQQRGDPAVVPAPSSGVG